MVVTDIKVTKPCPDQPELFLKTYFNQIVQYTSWGDKHFCIERGGQTFFVGGGGRYDDVDKEIDVSEASFPVSEANIFVSEASKLSAGARIFKGPQGPEILVCI